MTTATVPDSERLGRAFQALSDETRLGVIRLLARGERCVCDLQDPLDAAQSRLSFHLKRLKEVGLVRDRKEGRWVYYSLVPGALDELAAFLDEVRERAERAGAAPGCACGGDGRNCC